MAYIIRNVPPGQRWMFGKY